VTDPTRHRSQTATSFTRRAFCGRLGAAGLALPLASTLAACGSGGASGATGGKARRGGVVQMAVGSVSTSENLDPTHQWNQNEYLYQPQIYDPLLIIDDRWAAHPVLAESWKPNGDATEWTFTLRSGVRFHDGEPLTARDAQFTIRHILDPKVGAPGYSSLAAVLDPEGVVAADAHTLRLTLKHPVSILPILIGRAAVGVLRDGTTDFTHTANGTGPFKLTSFTPGQSWQVERNPRYWQRGLPYLDGARGVAETDSTTKVESVISGQSDFADQLDFSLAGMIAGGGPAKLFVERALTEPYIVINTQDKPFDDNRVRMAFKLAMDRRLIVRTAYAGHSVLTSDTPSASTDRYYPPNLGIRAQNVEQAKQLLARAGYPHGLDVELHTADLIGGLLDMTVAFAKTVEPAGIRVNIKQDSADTYYEQIWRQVPMFATWVYHDHPGVRLPISFTSNGAWQETNYKHTPIDGWVTQAFGSLNSGQQTTVFQKAIDWISLNEGYLNPGFSDGLFPAKARLQNVELDIGVVRLARAYLA
jgi:peptide/nickel transport system substrate-binding protein